LAALTPLQPEILGVPIDAHGIIPSELERVIKEYKGGKPIKFLYTIPTGQNPSVCSFHKINNNRARHSPLKEKSKSTKLHKITIF
jgi:hypothetical protein